MAISRAALTAEFTNMNFGFGPSALEQALINSYADQTTIAGGLTDEQARLAVTQLVGDTTAVAGLSYQFFTGNIPSEAGFFFLVNSEGNGDLNPNATDLNDPYYATFNQENRYYNFALNLGTAGGEGAADFAATYGGLSNADAVFVAYENIVGTAAAIDAGIDPNAARADILSRFDFFRSVVISRGGLADTPANAAAIALATKAVMVGYLLNEAFKASVGNLVDAFERFLIDLGQDGDATFGVDVIAAYPGSDDAMEFTLTSGADAGSAFTGGSGDDTFFATEDTLTSTDILDGGDGDDTLIIATSGSSDVVLAGFDTESIEEFQLTSDADSTRLDVSGAEDLQRIINTNSSSDVTLTGMVPTIDVTIENTTQENGGGTVNTTIQYVASATAGDNTRQQITLANVIDPVDEDGQTRIDLIGNADNVEIVDLIAVGENILTYLDSLSLDEVNVTGTGDLTVEGVGFDDAANVFDATNLQGDLDVTFDTSGVNDVDATGGEGDDRFDFQAGFDVGDNADGNDGTDLLVLNADTGIQQGYSDNGDAANAARGTADNLEIATLASGTFNSTINLANLGAELTTLNVNTTVAGSVALVNLLSTTTIVVDHELADLDGDQLTVDFLGDTTSDELNLTINNIGGVGGDAVLTLSDDSTVDVVADNDSINTLDLVINDDAAGGELDLTLDDLDELTTWNISGDADLVAHASGSGEVPALVTVNGAASTGDINLTDVNFSASVLNGAGISITTGSGDDEIGNGAGSVAAASLDGNDTINTGDGDDVVWSGLGVDTVNLGEGDDFAHGMQGNDNLNGGGGDDELIGGFGLDTLTGGAGADTFTYTNIAESQGVTVDVITDFVSGTDVIDLLAALQLANPLVIDSSDVAFVGNATTFGNAVTELTGGGGVEAVFVQNANPGVPGAGILYVDVNGDGNIDTAQDMAIQLNGVSSLIAADIQATFVPVTFTAAQAGFDTSVAATSEEGNVTQDDVNDGIYTTWAFLAGSTVDGNDTTAPADLDILNVTDTANTAQDLDVYANISDIDRLNLRGGTTALVTAPDIDGLIINIGPAGGIVATDGGATAQEVNGSNLAADQIFLNGGTDVARARGGNDNVTIASIDFDGSVDGGDGTDNLDLADDADISGATVTGIETLTLADDATISQAQNEAFTGAGLVAAGGGNTVTIVGGGSVTADVDVESYVGDAANQTFFVVSTTQNIAGGQGDDRYVWNAGSAVLGAVTLNGGSNLGDNDVLDLDGPASMDITAASVFNWETLEADDLTLTGAQHATFSTFVDTGWFNIFTVTTALNDTLFAAEQYNLSAAADTVTVVTGNETVNLGNGANVMTSGSSTADVNGGINADTFNLVTGASNGVYSTGDGADDVNFSGTTGGTLTVNTGNDNDTIDFSAGATVSGLTLDGGAGVDTVTIAQNVTLTSTTFANIAAGDVNLIGGDGPYSFDVSTWTNIQGLLDDATDDEEIIFTNSGAISAQELDFSGAAIENYVLAGGDDTFTIDLEQGAHADDYDLNISSGGTDTIVLNNDHDANSAISANWDITGFTAGVGGDVIDWTDDVSGTPQAIGLTFQSIVANSNSVTTGGAGAIWEITTASINAAGALDTSVNGTVEGVIAAAIGATNAGSLANGENVGVILYAADGTAYLYSVDVTTIGADLAAGDFTVELIGTLNGVGVDALNGANFV